MKHICCCTNFQGLDKPSVRSSKKRNQHDSGFTLIELLVALALSAVIMVGTIEVFRSNTTSYFTQDDLVAMQQNVRVAKMFLERDIRMAGCGIQEDFYNLGSQTYPISFSNAAGESDTDILTINYVDFANSSCDNVLPQLTLAGSMPAASAEAEISEDLTDDTSPPNPPYSTWDSEFICAGIAYGGTPFKEFKAIITSPDASKSDVVYITQVQASSDKIQNRPYAGFENKIINTYPVGSTIRFFNENQLTQIVYSVGSGSLLRNNQVIANNIEDLQFSFGLDTDDDDTVDTWINDRDLTNAESQQVRLIDVNVLGRSQNPHNGQSSIRPAIEDRTAANTSDRYTRKLLQVTVKTRNIR
ncbi:MAG: PilW family protein [Desulfatirhabdiaceae bacterium]